MTLTRICTLTMLLLLTLLGNCQPRKEKLGEKIYDLCVIGGGMFGSAAARYASADPSVKVCLIGAEEPKKEDYSKREIFGAHYDEGRITEFLDQSHVNQELAKRSIRRFRELERLSGISFYSPVGFMLVGERNSSFMRSIEQSASTTDLDIIDLSYGDIFNKRFRYMSIKNEEAAFLDDSGAGYVSPRKMVRAQIKVAEQQGCCVIYDIADEVKTRSDGIHVIVTEAKRNILAKRLLFATGAFTNFKNFQPLPQLNMRINKEMVAFLKIPVEEANRLGSLPCIVYRREDPSFGVYVLPAIKYDDGEYYLKIGYMGLPHAPINSLRQIKNWYMSKGDRDITENISRFLMDMLPNVNVTEITSATCVTSGTPSGLPYIDQVTPTVTVAVAGNGRGAKTCDEVGRLAAHLSLTGNWDSDLPRNLFRAMPMPNKSRSNSPR